jgi:hypothetical protein
MTRFLACFGLFWGSFERFSAKKPANITIMARESARFYPLLAAKAHGRLTHNLQTRIANLCFI